MNKGAAASPANRPHGLLIILVFADNAGITRNGESPGAAFTSQIKTNRLYLQLIIMRVRQWQIVKNCWIIG